MKKLIAIAGIAMFAAGISACNTIKGAGKDIERGGEKVQGAASNVQQDMRNDNTSTGASGTTSGSTSGTTSGTTK